LGVPPAIIQSELDEMKDRAVAKTHSRSILASMRDLSLNARWILAQAPSASPLEVSSQLAMVPCGPLAMAFPAEEAIALLLKRHADSAEGLRGA
jgi:hypothetical protein